MRRILKDYWAFLYVLGFSLPYFLQLSPSASKAHRAFPFMPFQPLKPAYIFIICCSLPWPSISLFPCRPLPFPLTPASFQFCPFFKLPPLLTCICSLRFIEPSFSKLPYLQSISQLPVQTCSLRSPFTAITSRRPFLFHLYSNLPNPSSHRPASIFKLQRCPDSSPVDL